MSLLSAYNIRTHIRVLGGTLKKLISNLDPLDLQSIWGLSRNAVRSRLNGERDLTLSEICALADLVGIHKLLDALGGSFE